jgi:epoxyqueuosine reductase QueG
MIDTAEKIIGKIRDAAKSRNIPVLGIGPCFETGAGADGCRPSDALPGEMLPGAKSQICFGIPVPRSVFSVGSHAVDMVWRSQNLLYRLLDAFSLEIAVILEENGVPALPIFGCCPMAVDAKGRVVGYVNQLKYGEFAGIGRIGRNGLLLHRLYGSRLMLGGVLAAIDLPGSRIPDIDPPECPADCKICIDSCPVKAISIEAGKVNVMRCIAHTARTPLMSKPLFALMGKIRPEAAARYMNQRAFDEHTLHVCSRCVSECPLGDEASLL